MSERGFKPSYSKEMRARAKQDGRHLVTIDVPGMCFKGPVDKKFVNQLLRLVVRIGESKQEAKNAAP